MTCTKYRILIFLIATITNTHGTNFKGYRLQGTITFEPPLTTIPTASCLEVKLEDATVMDAAAKYVTGQQVRIDDLPVPTKYDVELPDKDLPLHNPAVCADLAADPFMDVVTENTYTIRATLNLGWCSVKGGDDWIHKGDYLRDIRTPVHFCHCDDVTKVCQGPPLMMTKYLK